MIRVLLVSLLGAALVSAAHADGLADLAILNKAGIGTDGPSLVKFLQSAVPREGGVEEIAPLVKKMASEDFFEREEAFKKVITLGPRAAPFLRQALKEMDRELVRRAEECLKVLEGGPGLDVHGAVLRVVAWKKPAGAAAAVLDYLPFAPNERVAEEAVHALKEAGGKDGKADPALSHALGDKFPSRRAAAVEALAHIDFKGHRDALLKRLGDTDNMVRMRTGLALALKHERDAIPALIDLMEVLPPSQVSSIENLLQRLAEFKGPTAPFASPRAMRDAWASWWKANATTTDLARLTAIPKMLGRTLLVHSATGKVQEIDEKGNVQWEIAGLQFPQAAHLIGMDRIAILESSTRRLTIRTTKGEMLKSVLASLAVDMQPLPTGNFLVTSRTAIVEYNPDGAVVKRMPMKGTLCMAAKRTPAGHLYVLSSKGEVVKMDREDREIARFPVGLGYSGGIDITPEGHVLLTQAGTGRVVEFDATGKVRNEWKVPGATSSVRLPSGNTLVACGGAGRVVEINDRGAIVWEFNTKGSAVTRASKR